MDMQKNLLIKYNYDVNKDEKDRYESLRKALVIMGPIKLCNSLRSMYKKKNEDDIEYKTLKDDKKWLKKEYLKDINEIKDIEEKKPVKKIKIKSKTRKKSKRKSRRNKDKSKNKKVKK
jgi:hypothetical protein